MDAKRRETYRTLHEIRLRKEVVLSEIRRDNERMNILWKDLFRKPKPQKTGAGLADGFMLAWKLYRKFKK